MNNLRRLTIVNLQKKNNEDFIKSSFFKTVLSRITGLHLLITVQIKEAASERDILLQNALYDFYCGGSPNAWLKPANQNLTRLTLYANAY